MYMNNLFLDPVGQILDRMPNKSRRGINSALLRLHVVEDRSELKPKKKMNRRKSHIGKCIIYHLKS